MTEESFEFGFCVVGFDEDGDVLHSCGDVDELFDDLIEIGVNCFNPFQPEVMNVTSLIQQYRGRLVFHGGLSTQKTLPYGSREDVLKETEYLLRLGG